MELLLKAPLSLYERIPNANDIAVSISGPSHVVVKHRLSEVLTGVKALGKTRGATFLAEILRRCSGMVQWPLFLRFHLNHIGLRAL